MKENFATSNRASVAYERGDLSEKLNGQARTLFGYFLKVTLFDRNA